MMIRVIIFIVVVVLFVVIGLLSMALSFRYQVAAETRSVVPACGDEKMQEKMRGIMLDALDSALNDRIEQLFAVWLKDETGQPARAKTGIERSIVAYLHGQVAVTSWKLPVCGTTSP